MGAGAYNVLFLCTGNSARSIIGEALLNRRGAGRFRAYSAGSQPAGMVNPLALEALGQLQLPTEGLHSKHWQAFTEPDSPPLDFVFTVCDKAASEVCPAWSGRPVTAHWSIPDPAAAEGDHDTRLDAFRQTVHQLDARLRLFLNLPLARLAGRSLREELRRIGTEEG